MGRDDLVQLPNLRARVARHGNKSGARFGLEQFIGDVEMAFEIRIQGASRRARISVYRVLYAGEQRVGKAGNRRHHHNWLSIDCQLDDRHDPAKGVSVLDGRAAKFHDCGTQSLHGVWMYSSWPAAQNTTMMFYLRSSGSHKTSDRLGVEERFRVCTTVRALSALRAIPQAALAESKIQTAISKGKGFGHFHHTAYLIACAYALMNQP